jgi:nitrogen fixation NifU-like protein
MSEERLDLLRDLGYSEKAIRMISDETNFGRPATFAAKASHVGQCGDMLRLYLDVDGEVIRGASFEHIGCSGLQASAAALTTMIEGMTLDEAMTLDVDDLVGFLEGLPDAKLDCAELARDTLRKTIKELR